jgi:undecaprenyl-diphosphatase
LAVEIVLHLGTLGAVLVFFWREVWQLVRRDRRLILLLVVGTIPAAAIGIPLKYYGKHLLESPLLAGCMFPVSALLLVWASRKPAGETSYHDLNYGGAIKIGLLQAVAILPGISRSGATIAGGLACGLERRSAGVFAFLLAIPAIGGAGMLQLIDLVRQSREVSHTDAAAAPPAVLAVGFIVSMAVGLSALAWLMQWVQKGRLAAFAWYLVPLGAIVVAWRLFTAI